MARRSVGVPAWGLALLLLGSVAAGADPDSTGTAGTVPPPDSTRAADSARARSLVRPPHPLLLLDRSSLSPSWTSLGLTLTHPIRPLLAPRRPAEPNLFQKTVYGADLGGYVGMSVGVVGNWLGFWDERTAWALMGAGAAMGAVWGGTAGSGRFDGH